MLLLFPLTNVPVPAIVTVPVFLTKVTLPPLRPDKSRAVVPTATFSPVSSFTLRFTFKFPVTAPA